MNQTFPDSPQFRTGRVFEIPADGGMDMSAPTGTVNGVGMVGQQQPVHHGSPMQLAAMAAQASGYGSAGAAGGGLPHGPLPLAQLQLLQQQQQAQEVGWLGMQTGAQVRHSSYFVSNILQSCYWLYQSRVTV
jgi:hypothetical protein